MTVHDPKFLIDRVTVDANGDFTVKLKRGEAVLILNDAALPDGTTGYEHRIIVDRNVESVSRSVAEQLSDGLDRMRSDDDEDKNEKFSKPTTEA